jgi:hypothetical protein
MPRPVPGLDPGIGDTAMTDAERQARYRAARATGKPIIRIRRPAARRGLLQRWNDACAAFTDLQARYAAWLDALPDNQQDSATHAPVGAEALRAITELDLSELLAIEPPRGFGRD